VGVAAVDLAGLAAGVQAAVGRVAVGSGEPGVAAQPDGRDVSPSTRQRE